MKKIIAVLVIIWPFNIDAQPNCNVYKMDNDEQCYKGCLVAIDDGHQQGSRSSQEKFDRAMELCPTLDYAYREKSVPYLKRGDFITWKKLIDKAVDLNPTLHLGARGWCKYQFVRDYHGAIRDIEELDSMVAHDIGYSVNGDYHLNIAKALCYKALGEKAKAIEIIEKQLSEKGYSAWTYDYLHLGVLKMEVGNVEEGITYLKKSIEYNRYLAEPYYFLALLYKRQNLVKEFRENMESAKSYYLKGFKRFDPYTHPMDKIYLADIDRELETVK